MLEVASIPVELVLVASVVALGVGPLIHRLTRGAGHAVALLDGFVVVAILCMVVLEIIPHSLATSGWPALIGLGVGILGPSLAEGRFGAHGTHKAALWVAVLGMALHAITDGLALASAGISGRNHALELAVVLHRLPVGLAIWWLMSERKGGGRAAPWLVLGAVAVTTVVGFFLGSASLGGLGDRSLGIFQAVVGGLLMHVVSHGIGQPSGKTDPRVAGVGGLLGLGFVGAVFWEDGGASVTIAAQEHHHSGAPEFVAAFVDLFVDSAPALLIAYLLAGIISSMLGAAPMGWLRRGGDLQRATRGVVFGLPLPLCSCGVVPVYQSLVRRGVPATAALAFLVATPELGLDAVLLSLPLLGLEMALLRVVAAFVVALGVGWAVGRWADRAYPAEEPKLAVQTEAEAAQGWALRVRAGIRAGFGEILDGTGAWIILGLVIAASIMPWIDPGALTRIPAALQVGLFAVIGMPIYVCAAGATPLVAVLIAKGLSPGAALAFLLTGPATNATTFGVIKQLHGKKVAAAFVAAIVLGALMVGYAVDLLLPGFVRPPAAHAGEGEHGAIATAASVLLGGLFVLSFLRQGPRRYLACLWESGGHDHDHGDDRDHDHDHDHGNRECCGHGN